MTPSLELLVGGKSAVLERAFNDPALKGKRMNLEQAVAACAVAVQALARESMTDTAREALQEAYDTHVLLYGDRPASIPDTDDDPAEAWDSTLDDASNTVAMMEPWASYVSRDWLGANTVGVMLHEDGAIDKWCQAIAKEAYHHMVTDAETNVTLSSAKVCSAAGVVSQDVEAMLDAQNTLAAAPEAGQQALTALLPILKHIAGDKLGVAPKDLADHLDNASDTDANIAAGAFNVLGVGPEWHPYFVAMRTQFGAHTARELTSIVDTLRHDPTAYDADLLQLTTDAKQDVVTAAPVAEVPAGIEGPRWWTADMGDPKDGDLTRTADGQTIVFTSTGWQYMADQELTDDEYVVEDAVEDPTEPGVLSAANAQAVLALLVDFGGLSDKTIAEGMGVSRPTINNARNGKASLSASPEQIAYLRGLVVQHTNKLLEALYYIDGGAEPMAV